MAQIFHRSTNTLSRVSIFGGVFILAVLVGVAMKIDRSPLNTRAALTIHQPVPFSHEHHVSGLGIDCRYCHTSVEKAAFAGIPPVQTCNNCHSQIWTNAEMLGAGARRLHAGPADPLDPRPRPAGLRLLQPLDPRRQGHRLRLVPRPRSTRCSSPTSTPRCRWSGASTATAIPSSTSGRSRRSTTSTGRRRPKRRSGGLGQALLAEYKVLDERDADQLLDLPPMTQPAARPRGGARAARQGARPGFWRSLEELAGDPRFEEMAAPRVPAPGLGVGRRRRRDGVLAPQLPPALLGLAGARRPHRLHPPAARAHRPLRQAARGDRAGQAPLLRHRGDRCWRLRRAGRWSRPTWAGPPRSRATPSIRGASAATDAFTQAIDPRPLRPGPLADDHQPRQRSAPGRRSSTRSRRRSTAQRGDRRRGPARPDAEPSPRRPWRRRAARPARGASRRRAGTSGSRPAATTSAPAPRLAFGEPVETRYDLAKADVVVALDSDFLTQGTGAVRYARQFADRRRLRVQASRR